MQYSGSALDHIEGLVTPPEALDRPATNVQRRVAAFERTSRGASLASILRGRSWLGHPLHPLLTDLVTGAWTTAWVFDVLDSLGMRRLRSGADAAVALGLAGVPITAASGAADWSKTEGVTRRLGFLHAMLNVVASVIYTLSLVQRMRGRRRSAVALGHLGFMVMNASAYLGGELAYDAAVNVRHPNSPAEPELG